MPGLFTLPGRSVGSGGLFVFVGWVVGRRRGSVRFRWVAPWVGRWVVGCGGCRVSLRGGGRRGVVAWGWSAGCRCERKRPDRGREPRPGLGTPSLRRVSGWATALCVGGCMVEQAAPDWSVSRTRRPEALNQLAQRMIQQLSSFPAPYRPNGSNGPQIRRTAPYIQGVCVPLADCRGCNVPGSVRGDPSSYILELLIQMIHLRDCRGSNWFGRGSFCFLRLIQTEPSLMGAPSLSP